MAKIELRDADIYMRDGLAGVAAVDNAAGYALGATAIEYDGAAVNTLTPTVIPVGARVQFAGETGSPVHVVTAIAADTITISPALVSAIVDDAVITVLSRQIAIKVGDGNLSYTEAKEYSYELDRGTLDTVREGNDVPVSVTLQFVYEFVRTGTSEPITPMDALKGVGGAAAWISAAEDKCEPYAIDLVVDYVPLCSGTVIEREVTVFEDFRHDQAQFDLSAASISITGRSNRTEAVVSRVT